MVLTTHAIAGATLATLIPTHPVLGFVVGFGSHFLLDAIPHWTYSVKSIRKDENNPLNTTMLIDKTFLKDFLKIGIDGILGLALSFIIFSGIFNQDAFWAILLGAIGGMMPDALQFLYFKWKHQPLITLQKFHIWIHAKRRLDDKPIIGIFVSNSNYLSDSLGFYLI